METNFQPSFVPKRPIIPNNNIARPRAKIPFFTLIAAVIFVIAAGLAGGLYFYKTILSNQNETKRREIEQAIKNFDNDLTKQLTLLRTRLDAANQLLQNHSAFTAFLNILQQNTVQTVRYTDLKYAVTPDKAIIALKGEASSYAAIAFQSDVLSANDSLKSVVVSDLALNEKGLITFAVKSDVESSAISYVSTVVSPAASPPSGGGVNRATGATGGGAEAGPAPEEFLPGEEPQG